MRIASSTGAGIILLLCILRSTTALSQQLKLGKNPYIVEKSAVLELNADNQGLLLSRIADTTSINALLPPDGMVIFFTPAKRLLIRVNGSWQTMTVGSAISSLNGLTATTQTFATGVSGTDFNILSSGSTHTFNMPDASATARGLITTGSQTLSGTKTFSSAPVFSSLTLGSVPFIGTGGVLTQDNANFFWNAASARLGIGTTTPSTTLHVVGTNPLTLVGVQPGTSTTADSLLTITSGLVRKIPMSTFITNQGITSLNGLTTTTQTFATGTSGTNVNISSSGSTHTFNFPDASPTARGLITTGAQTIAGAKSLTSPLAITSTNPLTLTGVQLGTTTSSDSVLTLNNGTVQKLPVSTFISGGSGITSLNGLTASIQTFAIGTSGTNINISSSGSAHTFNFPDASATARGLVTTGAQTIAGTKTFSSAPIFSSLTAGSVPFIGTGGLLSQNNTNLFWDATNNRLGIGTNTPGSDLTLYQSAGITSKGFRFTGNSISGNNSGTGFAMSLGYNITNNKQLWLGDADYVGNVNSTFVRFLCTNGATIFDAISGDNSIRRTIRIGVGNDPLSTIILGDDQNTATPGSYIWSPNNMAIGSSYRASAAPTGGLIVQGNVGIGTSAPSTILHVNGTNPLTLTGVQTGTTNSTDSLLTITSGLVRKIPMSTFASAGNFWAINGNTVGSQKNFGTIDAFDLPIITSNTERMRIGSSGNVAIGTSSFNGANPEKFVVDAGTTNSVNAIVGRGNINNYLQLNIQNLNNGAQTSSDVVATADNGSETTNFIDMGINSSTNSANIFGAANDAYLYNLGQNLLIGTGTANKSLVFLTGGVGQSTNERMRIDGTGKVGIGTTAPTATLDVSGNFSLGSTGTINKNLISFESALASAQTVPGSANILGIGFTAGSLDLTVSIPAGTQPSTTRASVNVSTDQDLAAGVSIAWARVVSTSTVRIRFINPNATAGTLPAGMKLWITINEF